MLDTKYEIRDTRYEMRDTNDKIAAGPAGRRNDIC